MSDLYPARPADVPADLAAPSGKYKLHSWGAFAGLVVFVLLYLGLTGWFGLTVYRFVLGFFTGGRGAFIGLFLAIPAAFLFLFLVKGLFGVRRASTEGMTELDPASQADLVAFIHQVADDTGAPRPHRIFLSPEVNAAVFYDSSLWNLIVPTRKNLIIGLALVEVLTLDEFKAVLAHEFGHFSQKSMRIGTWVYVAHQIVADMISRRDWLDGLLDVVSRIDIRVAWIGWIMRLIVWSIRAVLETAFRGVRLLERALSREMEFQADLVSVSVCGSDSLVHALHKLGAGDDAWGRAVGFAASQTRQDNPPKDLFAIQRRVMERMSEVLDDPEHGRTPAVRGSDPATSRIFNTAIGEAPRMWSSHPPNHEREAAAKARYIASVRDDRPAWSLFHDAEALRARVTREVLDKIVDGTVGVPVPMDDTLAKVDEQFDRPHLDHRYRGAWNSRSVARQARECDELLPDLTDLSRDDLLARYEALYPESLRQTFSDLDELNAEKIQLEGLIEGFLTAPGGVVKFRGREVKRRALQSLLAEVEKEVDETQAQAFNHDREARAVHRAMAKELGAGWRAVHEGVVRLLHYAEHAEADLDDAHSYVHHIWMIITADGNISQGEITRLLGACEELHLAFRPLFEVRDEIRLGVVKDQFKGEDWHEVLPELRMDYPTRNTVGDWLQEMDARASAVSNLLGSLRSRTLDALVQLEDQIAAAYRGAEAGDAPEPPVVPDGYVVRVIGDERPRQKKLGWWDRFQTADGMVAGAARLGAAGLVLGPTLIATGWTSDVEIVVHNGLGVAVVVQLGDDETTLPPRSEGSLYAQPGTVEVTARTTEGELIETVTGTISTSFSQPIYNVAGASTLVLFTANYGSASEVEPVVRGPVKWIETTADHLFSEPPESIETSGSGGTRTALDELDDYPVYVQLGAADGNHDLALAHARWDRSDDPNLAMWFAVLGDTDEGMAMLNARLDEQPTVDLHYIYANEAGESVADRRCPTYRARAAAEPDNPDLAYLAIDCEGDGKARLDGFQAALERFPDHPWLRRQQAIADARKGDYGAASSVYRELIGTGSDLHDMVLGRDWVRVRRAEDGPTAELPEILLENGMIGFYLAIEDPEATFEPESIDDGYHGLCHGDLERARAAKNEDPDKEEPLPWLLAASVGATDADRAAAQATPLTVDATATSRMANFAIAARNQSGLDAARALLAKDIAHEPRLGAALDAVAQPEIVPTDVDTATEGLPPWHRNWIRSIGAMRLGSATPAAWRDANRSLFCRERIWIGR